MENKYCCFQVFFFSGYGDKGGGKLPVLWHGGVICREFHNMGQPAERKLWLSFPHKPVLFSFLKPLGVVLYSAIRLCEETAKPFILLCILCLYKWLYKEKCFGGLRKGYADKWLFILQENITQKNITRHVTQNISLLLTNKTSTDSQETRVQSFHKEKVAPYQQIMQVSERA